MSVASKNDFSAIMSETTSDMPKYKRIFSRFIHTHGISSASNFLSGTIGRPNALLLGATCSFSLTLLIYLLSKNLGYSMSGFEPIGTFLIGWTAGILFDIVHAIFKKKID